MSFADAPFPLKNHGALLAHLWRLRLGRPGRVGGRVHRRRQLPHFSAHIIRRPRRPVVCAALRAQLSALQEQFHKNLTLLEAETMAITILKQVMEEKLDASNVEVRPQYAQAHSYMGARMPRAFIDTLFAPRIAALSS